MIVRVLALLAAMLLGAMVGVWAQGRAWTLAVGHFGGTDMELEGCYFNVGSGAMLALHPKGDPCVIARDIVGRTGRLIFIVDDRQ